MKEFWTREDWELFPTLRGPHKADAVVVGGGLTGMTAALWLCRAGLKVVLLEAETLACGATARCGGMLSLANRLMMETLENQRGSGAAGAYLRAQMTSFGAIRSLAEETADAFDWQDADTGILAPSARTHLEEEAHTLRRAGAAAEVTPSGPSPFPCAGVLTLKNMATLHPIKYFQHLTRSAVGLGLRIFEHSRVTALETNMAQTHQGIVTAPYIVIATGYPIINVPGWYFLRLWQRRRSLLPLGTKPAFEGMYVDASGRFGLRKWQDGVLLQLDGGMVGQPMGEDVSAVYRHQYAPYLDGAPATEIYEGVETFSADGLPYIGAYSRKTPNLFVATGYGGQGLLGSMTAARLISARVLGLHEESAYVFSGQRRNPAIRAKEAAAAAAMAGRYAASLSRVFAPRCPHMGCKLVYSHQKKIWECPCHGSRFDDIGHLINTPAIEDAVIRRSRY